MRQFDTVRLIPSRFVETEDSVLAPLADDADALQTIFDLDNATNARLVVQNGRGALDIGPDELVSGLRHARIVNASFCYPHPSGSRFNGPRRGAWYCAFERETALAEVIFHRTVQYAEIDRWDDAVDYQAFLADFNETFHDVREAPAFAACLDPDDYRPSQALAERMLDAGAVGVVYPSVRRAGGINLACFRPAAVGHVRKGKRCRLVWRGRPEPTVAWRAT